MMFNSDINTLLLLLNSGWELRENYIVNQRNNKVYLPQNILIEIRNIIK